MPPPERADLAQASAAFERAIRVGTREEDWDAVAHGWTGLGTVRRRAGNRDDAAAAHMQALAIARRHRLEHREGEAFHNLAVIAFERDRPHDGILFARRALDACEDDRRGAAALAADLARHWMENEHAFGRALPLFERVLHLTDEPARRIALLGNVARASAGTGEAEAFARARRVLEDFLSQAQHADGHAQALLEVAKGAAHLGDIGLARREGARALAVAVGRESSMAGEVRRFLDTLDHAAGPKAAFQARPASDALERRKDDLALELLLALR